MLAPYAIADTGDWPLLRHDHARTNRSPMKSNLSSAPRELWRIDTAVWSGDVEVMAFPSKHVLALDAATHTTIPPKPGSKPTRPSLPDWQVRMLDITGSGKPVKVSPGEYWAKLIPGRRGYQRVAWTSTWGDAPSRLQCFSYEEGRDKPKLEWQTEEQHTVYSPQTIFADVNGDGNTEIICAMHYRVMIFAGATGKKLHEIRYHNLRNYGFFGLFFEPGDPHPKFVNISDFANHFDVIDFDGKALRVAFRRDVESPEGGGILRHTKILRPGPNPLEDIDGDGHAELTFNFFNDHGDGRWHVTSYQPLTGQVKLDLKEHYLIGLVDVDGCGTPELLCHSAADRHISGWPTLRVIKIHNGQTQTLFTLQKARFGTFDLRNLPPTMDTNAANGKLTAAAGRIGPNGEPGFIVLRPGKDQRPAKAEGYIWKGGKFVLGWTVTAPSEGTIAVRAVEGRDAYSDLPPGTPARVMLTISAPTNEAIVQMTGTTGRTKVWEKRAPIPPAPIVVTDNERRMLIVETSNDRIVAYAISTNGSPQLLWQRPGRGMWLGSGQGGGLVTGDLDGDGRPEIVFAEQDPKTGAAAIIAVDLSGAVRWRYVFPGYDSDRPEWNIGGLTLWTLAHLNDPKRLDVYVSARRSTMHSDVSFALDGRTGKLLWSGDGVPINGAPTWGFGGAPVACVDLEGNGLQQIVSLYPVCYYVVDGRNGHFIRTVDLASQKVLPGWAAYAHPIVADFVGNGTKQVLVPSPYVYGLLTPEGKAIWNAPAEVTTPIRASTSGAEVGNFFGDGRWHVVRLIGDSYVEVLDGATGKRIGTPFHHTGLSFQGAVVADVDGDGADELLLRTGANTLGALSLRKGGLLWTIPLPSNPMNTIIADTDGDGKAEIVVGCADGSVVALGK